MEKEIFGHINLGMLLAFVLGIACLLLYCWKTNTEQAEGYNAKRYMKLSWPNVLFHFVSSFLLLLLLHEVGELIIKYFAPQLNGSKLYHNTLSALVGMFGSVMIAKVFEFVRKKQNKIDPNIKHAHDENCSK